MIKYVEFSTGAAPTATAGSATATGYSPEMEGEIFSIALKYVGSPPATTDVVVTDARDPSATPILSIANAATDGRWYPDVFGCDYDGHPTIHEARVPIASRLKAVMTGANSGDSVTVGVWYGSA